MSMGMFSILPVPKNSWDDKYMHLIIIYLPLVGAIIGGIWAGAAFLLANTFIPLLLQSVIVLLMPFMLSGFLHMDGYMDTSDAILSRRSIAEKRTILKDSHVGAFAVIAFVCLILLQFSAVYTIIEDEFLLSAFVLISVISRCISGLGLLNLKSISDKGYMASFKANTKPFHSIIMIIYIVLTLIIGYLLYGMNMIICLSVVAISACITMRYVYRQLDGMSGDLCGCVITVSELCGLVSMAILSSMEGLY